MATFSNDTKFDSIFQKALLPLISKGSCIEFTVATGYVGVPILKKMESKLLAIARSGKCRIVVGMIFHLEAVDSEDLVVEDLVAEEQEVAGR